MAIHTHEYTHTQTGRDSLLLVFLTTLQIPSKHCVLRSANLSGAFASRPGGGGGGQEGRDLREAPADVQPALVGLGAVAVAPGAVWMQFGMWKSYFPNNPLDSGAAVTGFSRFVL